ncbi:MAG: glycosyltransferase family 39 protein [Chloroflexi bacterium]|nr:glycosyltransferase family 39 protein [Chloroflexota bacterium]
MRVASVDRLASLRRSGGGPIAARLGVGARVRVLVLAGVGALFLLSFYPRAIGLDGNLTADEHLWLARTTRFARALDQGDAADTYRSGHPGVTTMWAALIGLGPARALALADLNDAVTAQAALADSRHVARRSFAALTALAVVGVALLTWRLFGAGPGLLAGVLLGLEPFFLAHSTIVHVDTNVTIWMSVGLLAALIYFWAGGGRGYLALSGGAAGLAFLSKAPSVLLPLFVLVLAVSAVALRAPRPPATRLLADGLIWGALAFAVAMLLWPAFRTDPISTLRQMVDYTEAVGGSDHENFFLGRPVGDPGPLYYLVVLGFRLTPVTMLGLILLPVGLVSLGRLRPVGWAPRVGLLVAYCLLFVGMMTLAPKKFDRYLLPIFPVLEVLAAIGFWLAARCLPRGVAGRAVPVFLLLVGAAQVLPAALVYPYYLAYYNPLLGGGAAAERAILVGWGEGLDIVTDHLNAKPDAARLVVAGRSGGLLGPHLRGPRSVNNVDAGAIEVDYIFHYVNRVQRQQLDPLRPTTRGKESELAVTINGIDYARLISTAPRAGHNAAGTEFGGAVRLERTLLQSYARGDPDAEEIRPGDTVDLRLQWAPLGPSGEGLVALVELVDGRGDVVGRHEAPVAATDGRTARRGREIAGISHRLVLPEAAGWYQLVVGVREPGGAGLPVTSWPTTLAGEARRPPGRVVAETVEAS